jgi:hypothetical protein
MASVPCVPNFPRSTLSMCSETNILQHRQTKTLQTQCEPPPYSQERRRGPRRFGLQHGIFLFRVLLVVWLPWQIRLPHGFCMAPVFKNKFHSHCRRGKQMRKPLFTSALNDDCLCGKTQALAIRHRVRGDPTHDYLRRPTSYISSLDL